MPGCCAIDMPLRLLRSGVIDHVPWLVSIWLVDSARRTGEPRTPLAVNDHCRSGGNRQYYPSAEMQRVGSRHSPQGSKMARSILVRMSSSLGWAQSPDKPLLYQFAERQAILYRSGYMGDEASLYSGRRCSTSTGQSRRCGALLGSHGRGSLQGRPPNGDDATDDERRTTGRGTRRASSTKQGRKTGDS